MANQITVHRDPVDGDYEIWLEMGIEAQDGICLSASESKERAIEAAIRQMAQHTETLRLLLYQQVDQPRVKALR